MPGDLNSIDVRGFIQSRVELVRLRGTVNKVSVSPAAWSRLCAQQGVDMGIPTIVGLFSTAEKKSKLAVRRHDWHVNGDLVIRYVMPGGEWKQATFEIDATKIAAVKGQYDELMDRLDWLDG